MNAKLLIEDETLTSVNPELEEDCWTDCGITLDESGNVKQNITGTPPGGPKARKRMHRQT